MNFSYVCWGRLNIDRRATAMKSRKYRSKGEKYTLLSIDKTECRHAKTRCGHMLDRRRISIHPLIPDIIRRASYRARNKLKEQLSDRTGNEMSEV